MRHRLLSFLFSFVVVSSCLHGQEWRLNNAADAVKDFKAYRGQLWVISGSGLTRLNMTTLEKTTWNLVNSDLPDYYYNKMAIDSSGDVWVGRSGHSSSTLTHFDGHAFETITEINGSKINNLLDLEVAHDGKIWLLANTIPNTLYVYDQSQFNAIPLPGPSFIYHRRSWANICAGKDNHVWAILEDKDTGNFFIGEFDGSSWMLHDVSSFNIKPEAEDSWALDQQGNV